MTQIYFIRHAEPTRGANSKYTDRTYPLSAKGQADVPLVTNYLHDKNITAVLSSPFERAISTVSAFAATIHCDVELVEDLRERAISDGWIDNFVAFASNQWANFDYKLPAGESLREVQQRGIPALQELLMRYRGQNIAIGSHGTLISCIVNYYMPTYGYNDFINMAHIMPWVAKLVFEGDKFVSFTGVDLFTGKAGVSPQDRLLHKGQ